jgi:hypothetical protein
VQSTSPLHSQLNHTTFSRKLEGKALRALPSSFALGFRPHSAKFKCLQTLLINKNWNTSFFTGGQVNFKSTALLHFNNTISDMVIPEIYLRATL